MSLKKGTSLEQRQMNKKLIIKFLEEYRNNPCLWNTKCKEYNDRKLKTFGYDKLINLLRPSIPEVDKNFIVKKINTLRSCFRKEYKKVIDSIEKSSIDENLYKPSLWYYDLLLFTVGVDDEKYQQQQKQTKCEKTELNFHMSEEECTNLTEINYNQQDDSVSQNEEEHDDNESIEIPENKLKFINKNNKRLKIESENNHNSTHHITNKLSSPPLTKYNTNGQYSISNKNHQDEFDAFGFLVASKLRKISSKSESQQLFCENIINQALMKGLLGKLTEDSLIE